MNDDPRPILAYERHEPIAASRTDITRDADGTLHVVIPSPPMWQLLLIKAVLFACSCVLVGVTILMNLPYVEPTVRGLLYLIWPLILLSVWGNLLGKVVRTARRGAVPTRVDCSKESLVVHWHEGHGELPVVIPAARIIDLTTREAGNIRVVLCYLVIEVITRDPDSVQKFAIPFRPGNSMAVIEEALREALGLPPAGR